MKKIKLTIKELFEYQGFDNTQYEKEQIPIADFYIKTPTDETVKINAFIKKRYNTILKVMLDDGTCFKCSDRHIIIDEEERCIKDANSVLTVNGSRKITSKKVDKIGDVYDISIPAPHLYVTPNGVIHHNTSLARIIVNDILKCNYLYINASDESGIDTIRHKVTNFSQTKSFDGKVKVVILDECLEEGTLVTVLADGVVKQLPIKDLDSDNHLVKTYNVATDTVEWRPFNHACQGERGVYEVEFENGEIIICTDNHKWYVKEGDEIVRKKLIDIINEGITEIITKVDGVSAYAQ